MAKGQLRIRILGDASGVKPAMSAAVSAVAAGAAAMGATFIAGVSKALDVGAASDKMAASLGLSPEESKRLGGIAGKLYANAYGDSIETVSGAVESVISSIDGMRGASTSAVQAVTAKVLDLATAFELEAGRAAQVAGQLITTGLARDATHATDLLTAALQRVPKAVREDLLDAVDEYGPFMKSLGITGEKAMSLLVTASSKGMYGIDKLGDSLKEFTIRATDMSAASKVGFDLLGMSQKDMAAKFLAGGETARVAFDQIITGLRGIKDPVKQSQAALALFGTPLEDLNVSEIPKFLAGLDSTKNNLGQVAGAADRMGETLNNNAKTNLVAFWRSLQMAFVDVLGGQVLPLVSSLASWLREHIGPAFSAVGTVLNATVVPAFQWLSSVITEHSTLLGFLTTVVAGAVAGYLVYQGAVTAINLVTKIWTAATKAQTVAQTLLNIAMRANPIGIVITLVGALAAGIVWLWNRSEKFRSIALGVWHAIEPAVRVVGDAIDWVIDRIGEAIRMIKKLASAAANIGSLTSNAISNVTGMIPGLATGGPVDAGKMYVVGEKGPELFFPNDSGRILSNVDSASLMDQADQEARATLNVLTSSASAAAPAGGGQTTVVNNFSFPNYLGSREELKRELRSAVRTEAGGSAERWLRPANA